MKQLKGALVLMLAMACMGSHCNSKYVKPPSGPGTDYPCGLDSHGCSNGKCCWNDYDCGNVTPGCPQDMCCYGGPQNTFKRTDAGKPMPRIVPMFDPS